MRLVTYLESLAIRREIEQLAAHYHRVLVLHAERVDATAVPLADILVVEDVEAMAPLLAAAAPHAPAICLCAGEGGLSNLRHFLDQAAGVDPRHDLSLPPDQSEEAAQLFALLDRVRQPGSDACMVVLLQERDEPLAPVFAFACANCSADSQALELTVSAADLGDALELLAEASPGSTIATAHFDGVAELRSTLTVDRLQLISRSEHPHLSCYVLAETDAALREEAACLGCTITSVIHAQRAERRRNSAQFLLEIATHAEGIDCWELWLETHALRVTNNSFSIIRDRHHPNCCHLEELERLIHPADMPRWRAFIRALRQAHDACQEVEVRIFDRESTWRWIYWRGSALQTDAAGMPRRIAGVYQDTTIRREAEEAGGRLITAIEQAGESVMITSTDGIIEYVNPAFTHITGYEERDVIGQSSGLLSSGQHSRQFYQQLWDTLNRGETWSGSFINRRKDGEIFFEEATISPVRDDQGTIVNYVGVARDVTAERELEAQLRQAQSMESIGRLAGGVAHDFNNLLMGIMLFADLALRRLDADDPLYRQLSEIRSAGADATELIRKLMTISRKQALRVGPCDINDLIGNVASMLDRLIGEDITLVCDLDSSLRTISADAEQLRQVLLNLAINARDAMPRGGFLEISTSNVYFDAETARRHALDGVGWYVRITMQDTGEGIRPEIIEHIYEPFFTTKEQGRGTGLGLATVYSIVRQHSGLITVDSILGAGSTFCIYLPRGESASADPDDPTESAEMVGGSETLMLVEDEPLARHVLVEILTSLGYTVHEAEDGAQAIDIAGQLEAPIDLLITDVVMPGLSGPRVYDMLAEQWPGLKVLLISGYAHERVRQEILSKDIGPILSKPFSMPTLARTVRELLDDPPPRDSHTFTS